MAKTHPVQQLLALAEKFVCERKGEWDHEAWECLLADAAKTGMDMGDEAKRNLGNILECMKYFYHTMPEKAPEKPKAKAKAKPKAKKAD